MRSGNRQLLIALIILIVVVVGGTSGYMILEGWPLTDALYMVVLSVTTTGFQEVRPLSATGRLLTSMIIVLGLLAIGYLAGRLAQLLIESYLFRRKRMERRVRRMKNHYIVCGYGRMGYHICQDLQRAKVPYVVIERDSVLITTLADNDVPYVEGDSSSDEILERANIRTARGLITVVSSDAENVFTTLSAKTIRPDLLVVSRALGDEAESKLRKAGADRVIKPYEEVGRRMAQLLLRPGVMEFIDTVAHKNGQDISLEEIRVQPDSFLVGKTLRDLPLRTEWNIIVVAIHRKNGEFIYNPASTVVIAPDDRMIVIGEMDSLKSLAGV